MKPAPPVMKIRFPLSTATTVVVALLATVTASLAITIWPQGTTGPAVHRTVTCPGSTVCARLTRAAFAPAPRDVVCAQIVYGPQVAAVTGRIDGRTIRARFNRVNSCEDERWRRLAFLFRT